MNSPIMDAHFAALQQDMKAYRAEFGPYEHPALALFEDAPCYDTAQLAALHRLGSRIPRHPDTGKRRQMIAEYVALRDAIRPLPNAPARVYLWPRGQAPTHTEYTDNSDFIFDQDPGFEPYLFEMLLPESTAPKGAVLISAGAAHGASSLPEGYQTALDFNAMGYQAFILASRPNRSPWSEQEAGADIARAVRLVRQGAARYRIRPSSIAFCGFSNGGFAGEAAIQYYSGSQTVAAQFPGYRPDALDGVDATPNAFLCIYGPRWRGVGFDYTHAVYPPTFFAVGTADHAHDNLLATWPELAAHGVQVEVHTFAGVPHGVAGSRILNGGIPLYPAFEQWLPLADSFLQRTFAQNDC